MSLFIRILLLYIFQNYSGMYEITEDSNDVFSIRQTTAAERMYFVNNRVVPLALFMLAVLVFQQMQLRIPMGWIYIAGIVLISFACYILLQKRITGISITSSAIKIAHHGLHGNKEISLQPDKIKAFQLIEQGSSLTKKTFMLHTTDNKKMMLLKSNDTKLIQQLTTAIQKILPGKFL